MFCYFIVLNLWSSERVKNIKTIKTVEFCVKLDVFFCIFLAHTSRIFPRFILFV